MKRSSNIADYFNKKVRVEANILDNVASEEVINEIVNHLPDCWNTKQLGDFTAKYC